MHSPPKKLVVLTSGGDAPGMNAALRAVVRTAIHYGAEVYAAEAGYQGLVNQALIPLDARSVGNCIQRGGTLLRTGRCKAFFDPAVRKQCRQFLNAEQIDGLIVLGGNGSFTGAALLHAEGGPPCVGIPCTIDNDIAGTDYTIGFDTACQTALDSIDKIRDTAFSLERHFLIEVMGRDCGFLAVEVGMAGGAEIILTPEFPMSDDELVQKIQQKNNKKMASILVVAEAGHPGRSITLAKMIREKTGIEYKVCILGHTQRGGSPTTKDRNIASLMGAKAVEALRDGATQHMMATQGQNIIVTDLPHPEKATRFLTDQSLLRINEIICESP